MLSKNKKIYLLFNLSSHNQLFAKIRNRPQMFGGTKKCPELCTRNREQSSEHCVFWAPEISCGVRDIVFHGHCKARKIIGIKPNDRFGLNRVGIYLFYKTYNNMYRTKQIIKTSIELLVIVFLTVISSCTAVQEATVFFNPNRVRLRDIPSPRLHLRRTHGARRDT